MALIFISNIRFLYIINSTDHIIIIILHKFVLIIFFYFWCVYFFFNNISVIKLHVWFFWILSNAYFIFYQIYTGTGVISHYVNLNIVVPEAFILGSGEHHVDTGSVISLVCIIEKVRFEYTHSQKWKKATCLFYSDPSTF